MSWGGETERRGERGTPREEEEEEGSSPTCKKRVEGGTYGAQRRGRSLSGMREGEIEWMIRKESRLGWYWCHSCLPNKSETILENFK